MNYSGWRTSKAIHADYVDKHARFIEQLEQKGYGVRILVGQTTDWIAVREIEARARHRARVELDEPVGR